MNSVQEILNNEISLLKDFDFDSLEWLCDKLLQVQSSNQEIFVCGNGGSSSLSEHFCCDHQKIIHEKTNLKFKFNSLNSNSSLNTAIANDISYDSIFSKQLEFKAQKGDLLIVISASGNSQNIINALEFAKKNNLASFGLFGEGGIGERLTDNCFLVKSKNVQIIEDIHTIFMHLAFVGVINKIELN